MEESVKSGDNRQPDGTFGPNNIANPKGRPVETEEEKLVKKLTKKANEQYVEEYKESLASALPEISPVLIAKAKRGDIQAIKEIDDIMVEKAPKKEKHEGEVTLKTIIINKSNGESGNQSPS